MKTLTVNQEVIYKGQLATVIRKWTKYADIKILNNNSILQGVGITQLKW